MSFYANADGVNLMSGLGLAERNYVLTPENFDYIVELFENSSYVEFNKKPIYNVAWSANVLNIINEYSKAYNLQFNYEDTRIESAVNFMKENVSKNITIEELSKVVYMQPTYFIRCFKKAYGYSPMAYFKKLKLWEF
jgi:YesN/AraC family two-component response regulator